MTLLLPWRVRGQHFRQQTVGPVSSRTAALCSVSLQMSYRGGPKCNLQATGLLISCHTQQQSQLPRRQKTHPPPHPPMAYHHFYFICFIYFLDDGATSAHANTKGERADTDNQSDFSGVFPFPRHNGISARVD